MRRAGQVDQATRLYGPQPAEAARALGNAAVPGAQPTPDPFSGARWARWQVKCGARTRVGARGNSQGLLRARADAGQAHPEGAGDQD
jgi:hypothetical protein